MLERGPNRQPDETNQRRGARYRGIDEVARRTFRPSGQPVDPAVAQRPLGRSQMAEGAVLDVAADRGETSRARVDHVNANVQGGVRLDRQRSVAGVAGTAVVEAVQDLA